MAVSICPHIHNSPTMAIFLRTQIHPLRNPNLLSVRLQSFPSHSSLNYIRIRQPLTYRKDFHATPLFVACLVKNGGIDEPDSKDAIVDEELEARGESSMPERFRYLYKEVPDRPVRWPWAIALFFLVYAWRTVLWELSNWKKAALAILRALGWLGKVALASTPVSGLISCAEFILYSIKYVYTSIIVFAPVPELTRIILFTSIILAIAEAAVPDSVNSQPYLLSLAGIISFGAVRGLVPELFFWVIVTGMFFYSKFIKKRDSVSASLPSAAVFAAVGEPWVRGIIIISYLALCITHYSKYSNHVMGEVIHENNRRPPLPLLVVSFVIGINLAAKWIRYRHLTWMIA